MLENSTGTFRQGEGGMPIRIGRAVVPSIGCAVKSIDRQIGIRLSRLALHRQDERLGHGDAGRGTTRKRAGVGTAAPELSSIQIRTEAVTALRKGQAHLSVGIGCTFVTSICGSGESIDGQS